jgi:hypothetical protein
MHLLVSGSTVQRNLVADNNVGFDGGSDQVRLAPPRRRRLRRRRHREPVHAPAHSSHLRAPTLAPAPATAQGDLELQNDVQDNVVIGNEAGHNMRMSNGVLSNDIVGNSLDYGIIVASDVEVNSITNNTGKTKLKVTSLVHYPSGCTLQKKASAAYGRGTSRHRAHATKLPACAKTTQIAASTPVGSR